jgi:hypothetical protein
LFKSSRYIRLLVACFVASYPFFIPPYVSIRSDRSLMSSIFLNMVCCWTGTSADLSPICRIIGLPGRIVLCFVQHHIGYRSYRVWLPCRCIPRGRLSVRNPPRLTRRISMPGHWLSSPSPSVLYLSGQMQRIRL